MLVQTERLQALGVDPDRIYIDRGFSGTTRTNRSGLDQALAAVWARSVFTVTKFDRFARNMAEANEILTDIRGRGVLFGLGPSVCDWNDRAPNGSSSFYFCKDGYWHGRVTVGVKDNGRRTGGMSCRNQKPPFGTRCATLRTNVTKAGCARPARVGLLSHG
jgi:hypothetical protein